MICGTDVSVHTLLFSQYIDIAQKMLAAVLQRKTSPSNLNFLSGEAVLEHTLWFPLVHMGRQE